MNNGMNNVYNVNIDNIRNNIRNINRTIIKMATRVVLASNNTYYTSTPLH